MNSHKVIRLRQKIKIIHNVFISHIDIIKAVKEFNRFNEEEIILEMPKFENLLSRLGLKNSTKFTFVNSSEILVIRQFELDLQFET